MTIERKCACFLKWPKFIKIGNLVQLTCTKEKKGTVHTQRNLAQFRNRLIIHLESLHGIVYNSAFYLQISITLFFYNKEGNLEDLTLFHRGLPWMTPPHLLACLHHCHSKILTLEVQFQCQFSPLAPMCLHLCNKQAMVTRKYPLIGWFDYLAICSLLRSRVHTYFGKQIPIGNQSISTVKFCSSNLSDMLAMDYLSAPIISY